MPRITIEGHSYMGYGAVMAAHGGEPITATVTDSGVRLVVIDEETKDGAFEVIDVPFVYAQAIASVLTPSGEKPKAKRK
jgi:hypothetical protein